MLTSGSFRTKNLRKYMLNKEESAVQRVQRSSSSFRSSSLMRSNSYASNEASAYKSAVVFDNRDNKKQIVHQFNIETRREIASLTKIMTCYTTLQYIESQRIVPEDVECSISKEVAEIQGTTSSLEQGYMISLWDLLYGLMLPSGNDAALCIAQNLGSAMGMKSDSESARRMHSPTKSRATQKSWTLARRSDESVRCFVREMNRHAKALGMSNTQYNNPHGLADSKNYSCAHDQLLLVRQCLKSKTFMSIVSTKLYFGCMRSRHEIWTHEIIWENTNRLLWQGFRGVKTGSTVAAGYCLASWYCTGGHDLILIVLGCNSKEERDQHTVRLTRSWLTNTNHMNNNSD